MGAGLRAAHRAAAVQRLARRLSRQRRLPDQAGPGAGRHAERAGAAPRRPWRRALAEGETGAALRVAALLSLLVWTLAVLAGRWIGFL
ncbi:hypothetical protein [Teichococcus aestuarii]|uniref:hypothetical protein n=1 Tax=Teichococcus aestuarii TaxID=568898 RepID=UPI00360C04C5